MDNVRILPLCAMTKWDTPIPAKSSFTKKKKNKRKKETSREVVEKKTSRRLSVQHLGSATETCTSLHPPTSKMRLRSEPTTRFRLVLQTRV